jgi:hypothetical protein
MTMRTLIEQIEREMEEAGDLPEHLQSEGFVGWGNLEQGLPVIDPSRFNTLDKTYKLLDKTIKPLEKLHREIVKAKDELKDYNPKAYRHGESDTLMYNAMSHLSYLGDATMKHISLVYDVLMILHKAGEAAMPQPRD